MTAHTKGTWVSEGHAGVTINAYHEDHPGGFVTIVACPAGSHKASLDEIQANARLMATAPEMLDCLTEIVRALGAFDGFLTRYKNHGLSPRLKEAVTIAERLIWATRGENIRPIGVIVADIIAGVAVKEGDA